MIRSPNTYKSYSSKLRRRIKIVSGGKISEGDFIRNPKDTIRGEGNEKS